MQIYKITNIINLKIYIGKDTTANPNYFGSGVILKKAIKKYGKENFIKEIIDSAETKEDLSKKEKYWILYYDSISGAARILGIDRNWVRYRIKNGKWPKTYTQKIK